MTLKFDKFGGPFGFIGLVWLVAGVILANIWPNHVFTSWWFWGPMVLWIVLWARAA